MKLGFCAVCGTTKDLVQHHIHPVVFSGIKRQKNKGYDGTKLLKNCTAMEALAYIFDLGVISADEEITVCNYHHNIMHGMIKFHMVEHSSVIKEGLKKAVAAGKRLGRPTAVTPEKIDRVFEHRARGDSIHTIAKELKIGVGTTQKILARVLTKDILDRCENTDNFARIYEND